MEKAPCLGLFFVVWVVRFELTTSWTPFALCKICQPRWNAEKVPIYLCFSVLPTATNRYQILHQMRSKNAFYSHRAVRYAVSFALFWRRFSLTSSLTSCALRVAHFYTAICCELAPHPRQPRNRAELRKAIEKRRREPTLVYVFVICLLFVYFSTPSVASGILNPCASMSARIKVFRYPCLFSWLSNHTRMSSSSRLFNSNLICRHFSALYFRLAR